MSFWTKIKDFFGATSTKVLDAATDKGALAEHKAQEVRQSVSEVRRAAALIKGNIDVLDIDIDHTRDLIKSLTEGAANAKRTGKEDLARRALAEVIGYEDELKNLLTARKEMADKYATLQEGKSKLEATSATISTAASSVSADVALTKAMNTATAALDSSNNGMADLQHSAAVGKAAASAELSELTKPASVLDELQSSAASASIEDRFKAL